MKCQNCHESEATIHFKEVAEGELREIHLCENCAAEKGFHLVIEQNKLSIVNQFIWMAENLYPESASKVGAVQCERCGLRFSQFARTGRLGCADCYSAFASHLPQVLRRVHGAVRHKGRTPAEAGPTDPSRQALERLRLELSRAIEREEFETAAALRDQIRALESSDPASGDHLVSGDVVSEDVGSGNIGSGQIDSAPDPSAIGGGASPSDGAKLGGAKGDPT